MNLEKQKEYIKQEMESVLESMEGIHESEMTYEEAQRCYLNHIEAQKKLEELEFTSKMNRLKFEEELSKQKEASSKVNKAWTVTKDVFDMGIRVAGVIVIPVFVVGMAYAGDKDLKLVNGRIFNLIAKKFI